MVITVLIEIVLATTALLAGGLLWQLWKRDRFLHRAIHDAEFLSWLISPSVLDGPPSTSLPYLKKLAPSYSVNLQLVILSDRRAMRFSKVIFGSLVAAVLLGSYFLGLPYLVANAVVFFLSGLARVSGRARASAAQQILTIAVILDRWRAEDLVECDNWIKQAWSLRPLHDAVTAARAIS